MIDKERLTATLEGGYALIIKFSSRRENIYINTPDFSLEYIAAGIGHGKKIK
jgi:hypothetical protein